MLKSSREPSSAPPAAEHDSPLPPRKVLRAQLNTCFPHDNDLDAFALDWFPEIYRQFARGMTRTEKLNLLLGLGQSLEDVAKALATEWTLRTQATVLTPPAATVITAPRPRRGQQDQEIIIEDDFHALSPDKLAGWMQTIQRLVGRKLTVVLRNCRAGSVILTLRGDWRALQSLKNEFAAGRLRTLNGYRVRDIRWVDVPRRRSVVQSLAQSLRGRQLYLYLAAGRLQLALSRFSMRAHIPRWAVVAGLFFLFSGAAWAAQKVARAIAQHMGVLAPAVPLERAKPSSRPARPHRHHSSSRHGSENARMVSAEDTSTETNTEANTETNTDTNTEATAEPEPAATADTSKELSTESTAEPNTEAAAAAIPETGVDTTVELTAPDDQATAKAPASHRELLKSSAKTRPAPPSDADRARASDPEAEADQTLSKAQTEYVNQNYRAAISLSRSVQLKNPTRAWRIIGAGACNIKDVEVANEAFKHLDSASRQYLIYTCQQQGIKHSKGSQFRLSAP